MVLVEPKPKARVRGETKGSARQDRSGPDPAKPRDKAQQARTRIRPSVSAKVVRLRGGAYPEVRLRIPDGQFRVQRAGATLLLPTLRGEFLLLLLFCVSSPSAAFVLLLRFCLNRSLALSLLNVLPS